MKKYYDAIIVGSGLGGACIGSLLAHAGWKILILEKNNLIGGRCTSFKKDDFLVDLGMHNYLGNSGPVGEILKQIGTPNAIDWITLPGHAILQYGDRRLPFSRKSMIELVSEGERENMKRLFNDAIQLPAEELNKLWYVPLKEWINTYTKDPMAHLFITNFAAQEMCVGSDVASTAEFLTCFQDVMKNRVMTYPRGGNIAIAEAFTSAAQKYGGEIRINTPVKSIKIENGVAVGVQLQDGSEIFAPVIISNADIKATVQKLVGKEHFSKEYNERIDNLTYSFGATTLKVLLTEKIIEEYMVIYIPDSDHPTYYISKDMERGKVPKWVGAVSFITSNVDPALAPEGRQCISFVVASPTGQDWKKWEEMLLNNFYRVHPEAKNKVLRYWLETADWYDQWAGRDGTIIGVGQTVDQVHDRRPSPISPINGLYYCSADVGKYQIGTALCASAAQEVFKILTA